MQHRLRPLEPIFKTQEITKAERTDLNHDYVSLKEIISQTDQYLVSLSSNTYVFDDKLTKYWSV